MRDINPQLLITLFVCITISAPIYAAALSGHIVDGQVIVNYWPAVAIAAIGSPIIFFAYHRYAFDRNVWRVFVPINYGEPEELVLTGMKQSARRGFVTFYMDRLRYGDRTWYSAHLAVKRLFKLGDRFVGLVHPEDPSIIVVPGPKSLKLCSDIYRETFVHRLISTHANARLKPASQEFGG